VIKSARVMKKAVAHLIPFMEEEREARFAALGETMVDSVSCAPGSASDPGLPLRVNWDPELSFRIPIL
jgi:hypothetical protein